MHSHCYDKAISEHINGLLFSRQTQASDDKSLPGKGQIGSLFYRETANKSIFLMENFISRSHLHSIIIESPNEDWELVA